MVRLLLAMIGLYLVNIVVMAIAQAPDQTSNTPVFVVKR